MLFLCEARVSRSFFCESIAQRFPNQIYPGIYLCSYYILHIFVDLLIRIDLCCENRQTDVSKKNQRNTRDLFRLKGKDNYFVRKNGNKIIVLPLLEAFELYFHSCQAALDLDLVPLDVFKVLFLGGPPLLFLQR